MLPEPDANNQTRVPKPNPFIVMKPIRLLSALILIAGAGALSAQETHDIVVFNRKVTLSQDYAFETNGAGQKPVKNKIPEGQYEVLDLTTGEHQIIEYFGPPHPDFRNNKAFFVNPPVTGALYGIIPIKPAGNYLWFRGYGASPELALDLDPDDANTEDYFSTVHHLADEQGKAGKVKIAGRDMFVPKKITIVEEVFEQYEANTETTERGSVIRNVKGAATLDMKLSNQFSALSAANPFEMAVDLLKQQLENQGFTEILEE